MSAPSGDVTIPPWIDFWRSRDDRGAPCRLRGDKATPRSERRRLGRILATLWPEMAFQLVVLVGAWYVGMRIIWIGLQMVVPPSSSMWIGAWVVGWAATLWLFTWLILRTVQHRAVRRLLLLGRCPACGHRIDLGPLEDDVYRVCPECGAAWRSACKLRPPRRSGVPGAADVRE